ncbi:unnamed protein product, partial [Ectocarpus sp. 12 AP-2014]
RKGRRRLAAVTTSFPERGSFTWPAGGEITTPLLPPPPVVRGWSMRQLLLLQVTATTTAMETTEVPSEIRTTPRSGSPGTTSWREWRTR